LACIQQRCRLPNNRSSRLHHVPAAKAGESIADVLRTAEDAVDACNFPPDRIAAGQILTDQANLETANINLGYTEISSPVAGKIGRTNITKATLWVLTAAR
jgi:multidrug efflux pump subunit AcrA (membrane-fusion protein)